MSNETITTGIGRIVSGHPGKLNDKGYQNKPLISNGKPYTRMFFGLAIPKNDPSWPAIREAFERVAAAGFPGMALPPLGSAESVGRFAWGIRDGDSPDNVQKPGRAGCYIIGCTSINYIPPMYEADGLGGFAPITDPLTGIKCGDYVRVQIEIKSNGDASGKAGLYVNTKQLLKTSDGEAIVGHEPPSSVFGAAAATVAAPPVAAAPPAAAAPPVAATPPAAAAPPPPPPAAAPAAVQSVQMLPSAEHTYEAYIAGGWTDSMLVEKGLAVMVNAAVTPVPPPV